MVRVEVEAPIDSPLGDLLPLVPNSMLNVAPEQQERLIRELQGATILIAREPRFIAQYVPAHKQIQLSFRAVELLWCIAYAYVVLFVDVYATRQPDDRSQVDLTVDPVVKEAMGLLQWALQDWVTGNGSGVPALPARSPRTLEGHVSVADELCLIAVAFVLHHELAHHRLGHVAVSEDVQEEKSLELSLNQERDADAEAADWILGLVSPSSPFFTKRSAGVVVALMAILAFGVHTQQFAGRLHPRRFDRVFNTIDRYNLDSNHPAWVFATVSLKLHLDHSRYKPPPVEYRSFRDCLSAYIDVIAEEERLVEEEAARRRGA
jgi:hypothetical protein